MYIERYEELFEVFIGVAIETDDEIVTVPLKLARIGRFAGSSQSLMLWVTIGCSRTKGLVSIVYFIPIGLKDSWLFIISIISFIQVVYWI